MDVIRVGIDSGWLMTRSPQGLPSSPLPSPELFFQGGQVTTSIFPGTHIKQSIVIDPEDSVCTLKLRFLQCNSNLCLTKCSVAFKIGKYLSLRPRQVILEGGHPNNVVT